MPESTLPIIPYGDFLVRFNTQVFNLSSARQLNLALLICEKLLPEYYRFYQAHSWGNPDILLDAINLIRKSKLAPVIPSVVDDIAVKLEAVTPDMDDFGSLFFWQVRSVAL